MPLSRRDLFKTSLRDASLFALAPTVPGFLAATARANAPSSPEEGRVLVIIELEGGNDGVNTIVPFQDEGYGKYRSALCLPTKALLKVSDSVGLHPSLKAASRLLERGELAIVQGVGYPNPSRSHFRSMEIWHTARPDPEEQGGPGWLGRVLDARLAAGDKAASYFVGGDPPAAALTGRRHIPSTLDRLDDLLLAGPSGARRTLGAGATSNDLAAFVRRTTLDAYAAADRVAALTRADRSAASEPAGNLRGRLSLIARLLKSGSRARVYYTRQGSYDTHADQLQTHANLLFELSGALEEFQTDLAHSGLADRVAVLCFSEFGRTVAENGSSGTDHGTAGPVFLVGQHVQAGLIGPAPNLVDLARDDLKTTIDFRRIYASILQDWLKLPSADVLAGRFDPLPLFRST
ncbi:DUF1501 domain-containing protein [Singulisphaera acidiphila]|uniref:DUF1501 domain-containing protein n=1 Tax=Singulisphaera acidiphila (strain ATCC BAA-1392 / DSM 18658 / VKM B-2454 / MOB10) TaxID=886293 RepID=L0DPH7_SINAD|nr:DUF1501 domain-containing protein [Singulisphaera acidiphila]AGA31157.1 hypothetical protein Sinac_7103 [Singulisphaera acidiphila DSM 18658]